MNRRLSDNVKHIGPFSLVRFFYYRKVWITVTGSLEGGAFTMAAFEKEVGPWEEIGAGDEEKVLAFYRNHF